jgi:hypothetical protein
MRSLVCFISAASFVFPHYITERLWRKGLFMEENVLYNIGAIPKNHTSLRGPQARGDRRECLWCNPVDRSMHQLGDRKIRGIATSGFALLAMTCSFLLSHFFAESYQRSLHLRIDESGIFD